MNVTASNLRFRHLDFQFEPLAAGSGSVCRRSFTITIFVLVLMLLDVITIDIFVRFIAFFLLILLGFLLLFMLFVGSR